MLEQIDYAVIGLFLLAVLGLGVAVGKRVTSLEDYFLAGHAMPWWAVAISLYATLLTPMSFIGVSGWILQKDSRWFVGSALVGARCMPVAARIWVPFWARRTHISIYEFIEIRFGRSLRVVAAGIFIVGAVFWLGNALVAAADAFAEVTNLSTATWLFLIVAIGTTYTVSGGATAVMWTDVLQFTIFVLAFVAILVHALSSFEWDVLAIHRLASETPSSVTGYPHTRLFSAEMSLAVEANIWAIIFFRGMGVLTFGTEQMTMQRLLATRDRAAMYRAVLGFAGIDVIFTCLTVSVAWCLAAHHATVPRDWSHSDQALVHYVVNTMPGIPRAFIVAGLVAALLSTVDSGLNSLAAVTIAEFNRHPASRNAATATTRAGLLASRIAVALAATLVLLFAYWQMDNRTSTVLQRIGALHAVIAGPIATLFALGVLFRRATRSGALLGVLAASALSIILGGIPGLFAAPVTAVNWMWISGLSTFLGLIVGSLASVASIRGK